MRNQTHFGILILVVIVFLTGCQTASVLSDRLNNKALPDSVDDIVVGESSDKLRLSTDVYPDNKTISDYKKQKLDETIDPTLYLTAERIDQAALSDEDLSSTAQDISEVEKLRIIDKTKLEQTDPSTRSEKKRN